MGLLLSRVSPSTFRECKLQGAVGQPTVSLFPRDAVLLVDGDCGPLQPPISPAISAPDFWKLFREADVCKLAQCC